MCACVADPYPPLNFQDEFPLTIYDVQREPSWAFGVLTSHRWCAGVLAGGLDEARQKRNHTTSTTVII